MIPRSTRPVTTVPRPELRTRLRLEEGTVGQLHALVLECKYLSGLLTQGFFLPILQRPFNACNAEPRTIGVSSPGKSY